jgi:hypothetical protein
VFLDTIQKPVYFLDFETMTFTIPRFDGTKPNQKITYQYSLHYYNDDDELCHKDYIAPYGSDPRYQLAKRLVKDIPPQASVIVYNKTFEKGRLIELAYEYEDLSEHLLAISKNLVDILIPFQKRYYNAKEICQGKSLKIVAPHLSNTIKKDMDKVDYHNLDEVQSGGDVNIYHELGYVDEKRKKEIINNLRKYCKLDTYSTVVIYERLKELIGEK